MNILDQQLLAGSAIAMMTKLVGILAVLAVLNAIISLSSPANEVCIYLASLNLTELLCWLLVNSTTSVLYITEHCQLEAQ